MKPAVITPYYRETLETLRRCHDSVQAQTVKTTHILVADGNGKHHRQLGLPTFGIATGHSNCEIRHVRWVH